ncbi:MAG: DUF5011 domain-containing protein [Bacteroidales bacterium]|nr:DUF5011 domain-containing protein [Bacteroidales bacterium]
MNLKALFGLSFLLFVSILFSCNKDSNPPVITIVGSNPMFHCIVQMNDTVIYTDYIDPGATAHDEEDGDITDKINTTINVNEKQVDTYTVLYSVEDKAGNSATATRTVEVIYCK